MGKFLLKRTDRGRGWVSKPGRKNAYTNNIQHAQKFSSIQEAEEHSCTENEIVVPMEQEID